MKDSVQNTDISVRKIGHVWKQSGGFNHLGKSSETCVMTAVAARMLTNKAMSIIFIRNNQSVLALFAEQIIGSSLVWSLLSLR